MSQTRHWIRDWLTDPSLGQYFRIYDIPVPNADASPALQSTKELLKEHMVDSFFASALHHIDGNETASAPNGKGSPVEPALSPPLPASNDITLDNVLGTLSNGENEPIDLPPIEEDHLSQALADVLELSDFAPASLQPKPFIEVEQHEEEPFIGGDSSPNGSYFDHAEPEIKENPVQQNGYYIFAITLSQYEYELPDTELASGYPLFVYGFGKIQAVLSEVPLDEYGEEALQLRLNNPTWFEQTLRKHNSILGMIQKVASMVPMRICTICDTSDALTAFLNEHHDDFVSTLELIEGNQSWTFSITCNRRKLRLLTKKASNRVRAIQAEVSGKSPEEVHSLYVKLEAVLEEEARSVCKACVKHSHGTLSSFASKNLIHTLSGENGGESDMQEIFKCEYLISNQSKENFLSELHSLKESYKSLGFDLQVDGPYPPSQFTDRKVLPSTSTSTIRQERAKRTTGTH